MESLVSDIPAGDGKIDNFFYSVGGRLFCYERCSVCCCYLRCCRTAGAVDVSATAVAAISSTAPLMLLLLRSLLDLE